MDSQVRVLARVRLVKRLVFQFTYLIRRGDFPSGAAAFIANKPGRAIIQKYPGYPFSQDT